MTAPAHRVGMMRCSWSVWALGWWLLVATQAGAHDFSVVEARLTASAPAEDADENTVLELELILDLDALLLGVGPDHDPEALRRTIEEMPRGERDARIGRLRNLLRRRVRILSGGERTGFVVAFPGSRWRRDNAGSVSTWAQSFDASGRSSQLGIVAVLRAPVPSDPPVQVRLSRAFGAMRLLAGETGEPELVAPGVPSSELGPGALAPPSSAQRLRQAVVLGVLHIVPRGLDHVLFLLGLALVPLARRRSADLDEPVEERGDDRGPWRDGLTSLAWAVSMFTLAHAVTLTLAVYGIAGLGGGDGAWIEFLIAASIALVACEAWRDSRRSSPQLSLHRLALVFGFGLIHGLGFASILMQWLPPGAGRLATLIGFHVGVELGQLAVVLGVVALLWPLSRRRWYASRLVVPIAALVTLVALFWAWQRLPF